MLTVYTGHTKSGLRTKLGRLRLQYIFWGSDQFFYYTSANGISEIMTQVAEEIKKLVWTIFFGGG